MVILKNQIMELEIYRINVKYLNSYKCKARVVAVCPGDSGFIVGCKDGTVRIFDSDFK